MRICISIGPGKKFIKSGKVKELVSAYITRGKEKLARKVFFIYIKEPT
jgi:hypothetical protein